MNERTVVDLDPRHRAGPGTRLNDLYEIEALVASGGMGEVYRGRVIETGDAVAIKTIRPDFAENANALALFRKEASALHGVHHGAVVRYFVFSVDRALGLPYLAMEYVTGESLAERLVRGPMPFEDVEVLRRRLASGFQAAHEAGIIHRDVSPDNIILPGSDPARAKIIDFGIARAPVGGQTVIGDGFAGKCGYVSPEQFGLQGGEVTPRSDIYGLGLVLAQACLGRPLDMGASPAECVARRAAVPDLSGVDARLRPLLEAMLRPAPAERPESMAAVAAWEPATRAAPARTAPRRRGLVLGAGGAALAAAALVAAFVLRSGETGGPPPAETGPILAERRPDPPARTPAPGPAPVATPPPAPTVVPEQARPTPAVTPPVVRPQAMAPPVATPPATPPLVTPPIVAPPVVTPAVVPPTVAPPPAAAPPDPAPQPAPPVPASLPAAPAGPTMEDVAAYVRGYAGGPCFFLNPISVSRREAAVEAYGPDAGPFQTFDAAFKAALGFEASIQLRPIERAQCPVVDFLAQQAVAKPANAPKLRLDRDRLRSGEELRGGVEAGDRALQLLLVDADGLVHDLAPYLSPAGRPGAAGSFAVRLETEPGRPRGQLLVAISSRDSVAAALAAARQGGRKDGPLRSEAAFDAIGREAARPGSGVGVSVRLVRVGG